MQHQWPCLPSTHWILQPHVMMHDSLTYWVWENQWCSANTTLTIKQVYYILYYICITIIAFIYISDSQSGQFHSPRWGDRGFGAAEKIVSRRVVDTKIYIWHAIRAPRKFEGWFYMFERWGMAAIPPKLGTTGLYHVVVRATISSKFHLSIYYFETSF